MDRNIFKRLLQENKITPEEYKKIAKTMILYRSAAFIVLASLAVLAFYFGPAFIDWAADGAASLIRGSKNLHITEFKPKGELKIGEIIVIEFSDIMKDDKDLNVVLNAFPVDVVPFVPCEYVWIANDTLQVIPSRELAPATKYQVTVKKGITSLYGKRLKKSKTYVIETERLKLVKLSEVTSEGNMKPMIMMSFNAKINPEKLKQHLKITGGTGQNLEYSILENASVKEIRVKLAEIYTGSMNFTVGAGFIPDGGNLPTKNDIKQNINLSDNFYITGLWPRYGENREIIEGISVNFSRPVKIDDAIKQYIKIEPEVNYAVRRQYHSQLLLSGDFEYGCSYKVTFSPGLSSELYSALQDTAVYTVVIEEAEASVRLASSGYFQASEGKLLVPVRCINANTVTVSVRKIYPNNIVYYANNYDYEGVVNNLSYAAATRSYDVSGERNKLVDRHIDLTHFTGKNPSGAYLVSLYMPDNYYREECRLLIVTDIGIITKYSDKGVAVFCHSLKNLSPVADAAVVAYSQSNQIIARGMTNQEGYILLDKLDLKSGTISLITVEKGKDLSYLSVNKCNLPMVDFDIGGAPYHTDDFEGYIFFERDIYKPGEIVRGKIMVRDPGLNSAPSLPAVLNISRPDGKLYRSIKIKLDGLGSSSFSFDMPDYAMTGKYVCSASIVEGKSIGSAEFQIEEFVPDRIKTTLASGKDIIGIGEEAEFTVNGEYLFGRPASGAKVQCLYSIIPEKLDIKGMKSFVFSDSRKKFKEIFDELPDARLDEDGNCAYKISIPQGIKPPEAAKLIVTGTVIEAGGRGVSGRKTFFLDAYGSYVGLKLNKTGFTRAGDMLEAEIAAVKLDGSPSPGRTVVVKIFRLEWHYIMKEDADDEYRYQWSENLRLISTEEVVINGARALYRWKIPFYEDFVVTVEDKASGAVASADFYCYEWEQEVSNMKELDKLKITTDKPVYTAGEQAVIKIEGPFDGKVIVFLDGSRSQYLKTYQTASKQCTVRLLVSAAYSPNIYLSAYLLRKTDDKVKFGNYRAYGVVPIMVQNQDKILKLAFQAPDKLKPGKEAVLSFSVSGQNGMPEEAEIALSIVDEGVLRLTGMNIADPVKYFFRKRRLEVSPSDIYSYINPEPEERLVNKLSFGGDEGDIGRKHKMPVSVKNEKPISFWYPEIKTDANGKAYLRFKVPDFNGSLIFSAVAVNGKKFGSGRIDRKIKEPVILNLTVPRAVSLTDKFTVNLSVTNNTGKAGTAFIDIKSNGPVALAQYQKSINVGGNREVQVKIPVSALNIPGAAYVKASVVLNSLSVKQEKSFPVRPPCPLTEKNGSGELAGQKSAVLNLTGNYMKGTGSYRLLLSQSPQLKFTSALKYLLDYPYGCIEQTTSKTFPLLYLREILPLVDRSFSSKKNINNYVQAGIQRVLSMQTYSGGFAYWPGGQEAYPHGSVYAAHMLSEAKKAGFFVPEYEFNSVIRYLEGLVSGTGANMDAYALKCYALYVLSLNGKYYAPMIKDMLNHRNTGQAGYAGMYDYSRYQLIAALINAGDFKTANAFVGIVVPKSTLAVSSGGVLNSPVKETALIMSALLDNNIKSPNIPVMAGHLNGMLRIEGHWGTTHDNSMALLALGKFIKSRSREKPKGTVLVMSGSVKLKELDCMSETTIAVPEKYASNIRIFFKGSGSVFYYWHASGVPADGKYTVTENNMWIKRRFLDLDGREVGASSFMQGDLYVVEFRISAAARLENLYAVDLLPGGLEIENPRIATKTDIDWISESCLTPDYMDMRSDRLIIFFNTSGSDSEHVFRYLVRAVTPGTFILPPVEGACMYDPNVYSLAGDGVITVSQ